MTKKIFRSILIVAVAVLFASIVIIMGFLYDYFGNLQEKQLRDELTLVSSAVEQSGLDYLEKLDLKDYRITWVDTDGKVLFDTQTPVADMENHGEREEIKEAFEDGRGESVRYSATLTERTRYYAKLLSDGTVLRISVKRATIMTLVLGMLQPIAIVAVITIILSAVLANRMAKRIVTPLNKLDLDNPLENDAYEELSPLLNRINQQHWQISAQLRELKKRTDEFTLITASMNEGLVLLDDKGRILSINPAAQKLFRADKSCIGKAFLTVDRDHDLSIAIKTALSDGHSEIISSRSGKEYQFGISRIESEGKVIGAVLLAFDVTEQMYLEQKRREFTANVSHELKTPLQSIIGSAELIENGMVKPEDMPRFVGHIRKEASRLVVLIEDIIRLSQIDEGEELPRENVDLYSITGEVASDLKDAIEENGIKFSVTGTNIFVNGVRRLIYEIIYNLCDNAIKYNAEGGTVEVTILEKEKEAIVTVKDSGIGIPQEHQARVFERFYRVDKSHSKSSGGTGLGLSIVKHAAQYHHARIILQSDPGVGTEVSVIFPK